ncbi:MAG: hypothetical protein ACP5HU_04405 [Phycisphaerae bacterium]
MRRLTVLVAGLLVFCGAAAAQWDGPWDIPAPDSSEHPSAEDAPAADPRTYPNEDGFRTRARTVLEGVADNNLMTWRRGYFTGGDPGKYLPGHAMAKLLIGQDDPDIRRLYNDDRSHREHYHFAAVNWARFLPIFGEQVLTEDTREKLAERAFRYGAYMNPSGTENHMTMWLTSANVLPLYTGRGLSNQPADAVLAKAKGQLRRYISGIYEAGNGEWDSSTYIMFTMNGLMNIYDFAEDDDVRLMARAGLDWFATAYALKYRDGVFTAPNQRGFAAGPHATIADQTGFVWWDSNADITPAETRGWRYTIHAITSGWRPNRIITNIARKDLPELPFESRNSKPNYWGICGTPDASSMHETVYVTPNATMGTLWNGHGSQITRFQVVAAGEDGGMVFSGANPRKSDHRGQKTGIGFADGNGRYSQFAASGPVAVHIACAPADDTEAHYSFFRYPENVEPQRQGQWWLFAAGKTTVALYPLGGDAETAELDAGRDRTINALRIPGRNTGFVVRVLDSDVPGEADTAARLRQVQVDTSRFADEQAVTVNDAGKVLTVRFNPAEDSDRHGNRPPHVSIDGEEVTFGDWAVYDGPYVQQDDGVLRVNDGRDGFEIDFTGDLPVYRPYDPTE